ncbi:MAG: glucose-6-phosphate isomerase [Vicinamibacterales bacterium]
MHRAHLRSGFRLHAGPLDAAFHAASDRAAHAASGLWRHDPSTWGLDPGVQARIANRLGWLASPALMKASASRIVAMADAVRRDGIEDVVLLGMGGSSLAPEVLRSVIGITPGFPRLHMLDSTDPAAIRAVTTTPKRTLYLLASKSGTTIEPNSLASHFRDGLERAGVPHWGAHFIAITDPGTALADRARVEQFRDVFINPADIGGRYSALSFFGLVPAALMGQDVTEIVDWGLAMLEEARTDAPLQENGAVALGALMGAGAKAGRDKLTLIVPPPLEPFGLWVEQLVAESTGKQGVGVVPIAGETLGDPSVYGADRVFVRLRTSNDDEVSRDTAFSALSAWPSATIAFPKAEALGAEFMRWEIATAIAGAILDINPFDEPNVQQAKDATKVLLDAHARAGHFPRAVVDHSAAGTTYTLTTAARTPLRTGGATSFLSLLETGDYLALLAYLGPDVALADSLFRFRMAVRDRAHSATMVGYGPRYLHSTGQLHKGGANNGVFIIVTADAVLDLPIPDQPFSFGTLEAAQGRGDFASLEATGRRGLHIHLQTPSAATLDAALRPLLDHLARG